VIGGGPAGLVTAIGLALSGRRVTLAAAPHKPGGTDRDRRTAALLGGSIDVLRNIGAWERCKVASAPLTAIRIIDDTGRILRAPEVLFTAEEIGAEAFGYNVPNAALMDALTAVAAEMPGLDFAATGGIVDVRPGADEVSATTVEGEMFRAQLCVASDGRKSLGRAASGIVARDWHYDQTAIVTWFSHSRPHGGVSTEFHRPSGPFTTVPLPDQASSLVWVERREEAQRLAALDDAPFRQAIQRRLNGLLGSVTEIGPRASFPLSALTVARYGARRIALVGEAAHVIPPIGAQGLNLGFRDAAALVDCVSEAARNYGDIGSDEVLNRYTAARGADVGSRVTAVDILNRALLSPLLPVSIARGFGLYLLQSIAPLRRRVIIEGLMPGGPTPWLMRKTTHALLDA
ncbi:MAG: FAD-dependent monooxygenase, partial [Hyphomicrobium sp.]|nr:FAD-dependent monooxygenase [Hyphomicrobium sp.]